MRSTALSTGTQGASRLGRSLITLQPAPGRARRAVGWVAAVATGLVLTSLILGPSKGALGLLGAMAANVGRESPAPRRIRRCLVVGAATLLCQAIGMAIAPWPWLIPPVMTAITLVVVWSWHALVTGPPGPINTVFAGAFGTYMASHGFTMGSLLPITAMAWALATAASFLILSLDAHGPERQAVEDAEAAVDAFCELDPPDPGDAVAVERLSTRRARAWNAVDGAWHVLRTGRTPGTVPRSRTLQGLERRLHRAHLRLVARLQEQAFPSEPADVAEHSDLVPMGQPSAGYLLRTALTRGSRPTLVATRAALAVLLASSLAYLSPVGHPYWSILASLIILHMGASRADLTIRAAHRILGTAVGVALYLGIVSLAPGPWVRLAIVILAIYGLEAFVTRNYAVGVVFVSVFALMLTPTTSIAQIEVLARDRVLETIIGAGSAVLIVWLVGRRAPVLLVRQQYRLTLRALLEVLEDLASGRSEHGPVGRVLTRGERAPRHDPVRDHRRHLLFELGRAGVILAGQKPDAPAALEPWTRLQRAVSSLGYDVVAAAWRQPGSGREAAAEAYEQLAMIVAGLPPISSQNIDPVDLAARVRLINLAFVADSGAAGTDTDTDTDTDSMTS